MSDYEAFLERKKHIDGDHGFEPVFMPDSMFDFQAALVEWATRKGRAAIFADCGLGKTLMQLVWSENVVRHTGKPVLILTPLAVSGQTVIEAEKFGIEAFKCRDGNHGGKARIVVTNYERLAHFSPDDFAGVVCDESSILKNYAGALRGGITAFMQRVKYRNLCSATPSPNDYTELGNSVEALGLMRRVEMLGQFFIHDGGDTSKWRLKGHADDVFWEFVASWARAVRRPSCMGFDDGNFVLPPMNVNPHVLDSAAQDGFLFPVSAVGLDMQRSERKQTISKRCERVAEIAMRDDSQFLAWCSLNDESKIIASMIDDCMEVTGSMSDEQKEEIMLGFSDGHVRRIVTKPRIAGFGMNWQSCHRMSFFPSHSHEQYYQSVRRCWRFGQKNPVDVHIVTTQAESSVVENLMRKERAAIEMFDRITEKMASHQRSYTGAYTAQQEAAVPSWM